MLRFEGETGKKRLNRVFVYGTLKPEFPLWHLIEDYVIKVTPAKVPGMSLYAFPSGIPIAVRANTPNEFIVGSILTILKNSYGIPIMDKIELAAGYKRQIVVAHSLCETEPCYIYMASSKKNEEWIKANNTKIPEGTYIIDCINKPERTDFSC